MKVLLLSGGIESTCLAQMTRPDICLTVNYGQICFSGERQASRNIADFFGLKHDIVEFDAASIGSGQMAGRPAIEQATIPELWPYRNQLLITLTAMKFASEAELQILIGTAKNDSIHGDGTSEFIDRMNSLFDTQESKVRLIAPAIATDSLDLMLQSNLDVDVFDMTFSCFRAEYPCGQCRGCWKNEALRTSYFDERPSCRPGAD